jgi:PAS domain-containing protein
MDATKSKVQPTPDRQGVVIFDRDRRILLITPVAEEMLGWNSTEVAGAHCQSVFDCRAADGRSMCDECGLGDIFERRAMIESMDLRMQSAMADRVAVRASFWQLPPSARIPEPRAMAVLRKADAVA